MHSPEGANILAQGAERVKKSLATGRCGCAARSPETTRKLLILRRTKGLVSGTMDRPSGRQGLCGKPTAFRQVAEPKEFNLKPGRAVIFSHLRSPGEGMALTPSRACGTPLSRRPAARRSLMLQSFSDVALWAAGRERGRERGKVSQPTAAPWVTLCRSFGAEFLNELLTQDTPAD